MVIDKRNCDSLQASDVYIHDDTLLDLVFDRVEKNLWLTLKKAECDKIYKMNFINVIGFFSTSCDFWGNFERVVDFECLSFKNSPLTKMFCKKWDDSPNGDLDFPYNDYIESVFTFASLDELRIVSEKIILE